MGLLQAERIAIYEQARQEAIKDVIVLLSKYAGYRTTIKLIKDTLMSEITPEAEK